MIEYSECVGVFGAEIAWTACFSFSANLFTRTLSLICYLKLQISYNLFWQRRKTEITITVTYCAWC